MSDVEAVMVGDMVPLSPCTLPRLLVKVGKDMSKQPPIFAVLYPCLVSTGIFNSYLIIFLFQLFH